MKKMFQAHKAIRALALVMVLSFVMVSMMACSTLTGKYYEYGDVTDDYVEFKLGGKLICTDDGVPYEATYTLNDAKDAITLKFEDSQIALFFDGTHDFEMGTDEDGDYVKFLDDKYYKVK